MKTIIVKPFLTEAIKIGDPETAAKIRKRVVDLARLSKEAKKAAEIATKDGQQALADQLSKRAEELDELVKNVNVDTLDDVKDAETGDGAQDNGNGEDPDHDAEKDADDAGEDEQQDGDDGEKDDESDGADENADDDRKNDNDDYDLDIDGDDSDSGGNGSKDSSDRDESDANGKDSSGEDDDESDGDDDEADEDEDEEADEESEEGQEPDDNDDASADGKAGENDEGDDEEKSGKSGQAGQSEDDGSDDSENDAVKDPFADDEDIPQPMVMGKNGNKEPPRDATVDDIIKMLRSLSGEAKNGAIAALKDLLAGKTNESLSESKTLTEAKGIRDLTDDEFGDLVNDTLDMIEKAHHVNTVDDMEDRHARISAWQGSRIAKRDLDAEIAAPVTAEKQSIKARDAETKRYGSIMSLKQFELSFSEAIKNQVEEVLKEYQSYDEINPEYEDEGIIMKADLERLEMDESIPKICVYFDQSASWSDLDIKTGESVLATVKKKYVDTGLCKMDIYYFDDFVTNNKHASFLGHGSTGAWNRILDNIQATHADNVVIMTDGDMEYYAGDSRTLGIKGCVWWLWKRGRQAPTCVKHLIGVSGNYQAQFFPGETV